jgi:hypothetical protein
MNYLIPCILSALFMILFVVLLWALSIPFGFIAFVGMLAGGLMIWLMVYIVEQFIKM